MQTKEKIKKAIIEAYNANNINDPDKIDLNQPAVKNEDTFFAEFKKEILFASEKQKEKSLKNKQKRIYEFIEELDEVNDTEEDEKRKVDIKIMNMIEEKVLKILNNLNMGLYKNKKEDLKNMITMDMLRNQIDLKVSDRIKDKIVGVIKNLVDHEFKQYVSKKEYRRQELFKYILNKIMPEIEDFFNKHSDKALKKITPAQKQNLIKFFLKSLENKYLKVERDNEKITEEEYGFLRSKIKTFILIKKKEIL